MEAYIIISMIGTFVTLISVLFKRGVNEGRTVEILANLQKIVADHETRIRNLEHAKTTGTEAASGSS